MTTMPLWDKIALTAKGASEADRVRMNKLAAAIVLTSQGISFLHAGEEFLRAKRGVENSYNQAGSHQCHRLAPQAALRGGIRSIIGVWSPCAKPRLNSDWPGRLTSVGNWPFCRSPRRGWWLFWWRVNNAPCS
jgi:hypothetical protein